MISAHAVLRWLERVDGVDLGPVRRALAARGVGELGDAQMLGFLAAAGVVDLAAVRGRILTPKVMQAIGCGVKAVEVGVARLVIRDGVVVTVTPRHREAHHARRGPKAAWASGDRRPALERISRQEAAE